jgi:glycosyltransferase involved in cell wall biosynthesis
VFRLPLKVLLIGASVFQRDASGALTSKQAVVEYAHGLAAWFRETTWATTLYPHDAHTRTPVDHERVMPCIVRGDRRGLVSDSRLLRRLTSGDTVLLLHLPNPWLTLSLLVSRWRARGLFVYVASDYVGYSAAAARTRGFAYGRVYRFLYELAIRSADGVMVRGAANDERVRRLNRNVIITLPLALRTVSRSRHEPPCAGPAVRVLYVGKLTPDKGVEVLMRAFAEFARQLSPQRHATLTFIGEGSAASRLREMSSALGLSADVRFPGFVDDLEALSASYAEADLVVVPAISPEGVPRVIDEALMHGTPVVASAVGGIPAEFSKGELALVPPADAERLAAAMLRVVLDTSFRSELHAAGSARARRLAAQPSAADQHAQFIAATLGFPAPSTASGIAPVEA